MASLGVASAHAADRPGRLREPSPAVVFWGSFLVIAVTATLHSTYLFTTAIREQGDEALNSLLVIRAQHLDQLVGNYSRVGFHHPGPAFFYVMAAGQGLFHDLLHVVPAPYNGQLLGSIWFGALLIALSVLALYRATRSTLAAGVALAVMYLFAAHHSMLGDVWFPYLYMAPFLLFMVAGALVASGSTRELPSFVLGAGLLAHGHVSFLMFVGVTTAVVAAGWWRVHAAGRRAELAAHRRAAIGSAVLIGLFLLPVLSELVLHYPGPWGSYWRYVQNGHNDPRSASDVLRFAGWYWTHSAPLVLTLAGLAVAVLLMVRERNRVFGYLYGMLALQSLLVLFYIGRGVDVLTDINRYVGYFALTVPMLLVAVAAAQLTVRLRSATPRARVPLAFTACVLLVLAALSGEPRDKYRHGIPYQQLAAALASAPERAGRTVALDFRHDQWPEAAGAGVAATRGGIRWCVSNPRWTNLFTGRYVCRADESQWTLAVVLPADIPARARVVWQDSRVAVIERNPADPLLPADP